MNDMSSFASMKAFRKYTGATFMQLFGNYTKVLSNQTTPEFFEREDNNYLIEMAQSTLDSRGVGLQEWLLLQCFKQSLTGEASVEKLTIVTHVAVAFYAEFAAIEVRDDLPCFDNDVHRRGKLTIWKKFGERKAILFVEVLQSFAINVIKETSLDAEAKLQLFTDLNTGSHGNALCTLLENRRQSNSLERTLLFHDMKVGVFGGVLSAAGALVAGASKDVVAMMHKFGRAVAHCAQIDNDCEPGALADDMQDGSVNILSTVSRAPSLQLHLPYDTMTTTESICDNIDNESDDTASTGVDSNIDISSFVHENISISRKRLFCDVSSTGLANAELVFDGYLTEARSIIENCKHPNENLLTLLTMMEYKFNEKVALHKNDPGSPYVSVKIGKSLMGY